MTYVEQVKAEVGARYGVPVLCDVQFIPQGLFGLDPANSWSWRAAKARERAAERQKQSLDRRRCAAALSHVTCPDTRRALILRMGGKSYRQIAAETGWAVSKTHKVLTRAMTA